MKFEETPEADYKYGLTFQGTAETEPVGAAYREHVNHLTQAEEDGDEVGDGPLGIAGWSADMEEGWIGTDSPIVVAVVLERFHRNTKRAIAEIPAKTGKPAFDSREIPRRYQLAQAAKRLAVIIRGEISDIPRFSKELETMTPEMFIKGGEGPINT